MLAAMDLPDEHPPPSVPRPDDPARGATADTTPTDGGPDGADPTPHGGGRTPGQVARALIATDHPHMAVFDVTASGDPVPVDLRDYVVFTSGHATRVRTLAGDHLALDLWCVEPQQSTGVLQYAAHDVVYTVIGGRCWFVTEAGDVGLDPMGALLVPAGTVHGIDNRGADPLILSMAMAPPDEVDVSAPTGPGLAIRDDSQYGTLGQKARATFERLIGR